MKIKSPSNATKASVPAPKLQEADVVKSLTALAQAQRLRAFRALVVAGSKGLTPSVLAVMLDIAPSALSFHLKELLHAGLVSVEQDGRYLIYRAQYAHMGALMAFLTENCCAAAGPAEACGC
jgi:ArsR family transcriptional regulator, arsenate/arsenite/antimonite-responsive transcriptional repressor